MAFEVAIKIGAETNLAPVKTAEEAVQRLGQVATASNQQQAQSAQQARGSLEEFKRGVIEGMQAELKRAGAVREGTQALNENRRASEATGQAANRAKVPIGQVATAISVVGSQAAGLGPLASIASNALIQLAVSAGPASLALAGLTATVGLLVFRIQNAREELRQLAEIEIAGIARETRALQIENDVKRQIEVLRSAVPEIARINQEFDKLRFEAEQAGARPQGIAAIETLRQLQIGRVKAELEKQEEERRKREAAAGQSFIARLKQQSDALGIQAHELAEGAVAVSQWTRELLEAEAAQLGVSEAASKWIDRIINVRGQIESLRGDLIAEEAVQERLQKIRQEELDYLEKKAALDQRARDFELDKLSAAGAPETVILQRRIQLLNEQRAALESSAVARQPGDIEAIQRQIDLAEIQLYRLQNTSIDVAGEVGRAITDITNGVIAGTLRWADIGRSALASFVRFGVEQFVSMLRFQQQAVQSSAALAAAGTVAAPGQAGAAVQAATAVTGSGGGFFGSIGNFISSFLPAGSSLGSTAGGGIGGFLLGSLLPGGIPGQVGSTLGGLLGGALQGTALGASILGPIVSGLGSILPASFAGSAAGASLGGLVGTFALPIIGSLIGAGLGTLFGSLFGSKPDPTVTTRSEFSGISYDSLRDRFLPGSVSTRASGKDVSGGVVRQTRDQVQLILEDLSRQWTDILNIFPVVIRERMIPDLEDANAHLNNLFRVLKFSEGKTSIADQVRALGTRGGPRRFFLSLRGTIGTGLSESLALAGFPELQSLARDQFAAVPAGATLAQALQGGLQAPRRDKEMEEFVTALQEFAGITGGLARISPRGVGQFLTASDQAVVSGSIATVLEAREGTQFTRGVQRLKSEVEPVLSFLESAVQQTTDLFGRGLIAALEAGSESAAISNFQRTLAEGTRQALFQGITESFIASAQFNDLLAPIQQTIRDFTQEALATGQTPDMGAFRSRILPAIEAISTRSDVLAPLLAELQKLGVDIKDAIAGRITGNNITINLSGLNNPEEFERKLVDLLSGRVSPR